MLKVKSEVLEIRRNLSQVSAAEASSQIEKVIDLLVCLEKLSLTAVVIKETKIGSTVAQLKKLYEKKNDSITSKTKELLLSWKKIIEVDETDKKLDIIHNQEKNFVTGTIDKYNPTRKKIVYELAKCFGMDAKIDEKRSELIGYRIEAQVNVLYDYDSNINGYNTKVRSLLTNLKKNENMRKLIAQGQLSPSELVQLSPEELATESRKKARDKESYEESDKRRNDWQAAHLSEIRESLGIEYSDEWIWDQADASDDDFDVDGDGD